MGAGGTNGGTGRFLIGLIMMIAGGYLFLDAVKVSHGFGMGYRLYSFGGFHLTGGMVLVPFIFGIGIIFYNSKNLLGWLLSVSSLVMLAFGIISSLKFSLRSMSSFELLTIIVLVVGGLGLFLSSLRNLSAADDPQ
ncbi:MAG: hypothetical protein H6680_04390 [Desulfobacteraceae bacterium]|nr:hypothetical protein [Desulfobacteraceae bacterium]